MNDYELLGVSPNATFEELKRAWRDACKLYHPDNPNGNAEKFRQINEAYKRLTDEVNSKTVTEEYEDTVDFQGILDDYIKYAFTKYTDVYVVMNYLKTYLSGNIQGITRDHNFRSLFEEYLSPEIVSSIMGPDLFNYIVNIVQDYDPTYDVFMDACKATYIKYGKAQLAAALDEALKGNYSGFTNDGRDLRNKMYEMVRANDILQYLTNLIGPENLDPNISLGEQSVEILSSKFVGNNKGRKV